MGCMGPLVIHGIPWESKHYGNVNPYEWIDDQPSAENTPWFEVQFEDGTYGCVCKQVTSLTFSHAHRENDDHLISSGVCSFWPDQFQA